MRGARWRRFLCWALLCAAAVWVFGRVWPLVWALIWPFAAGAVCALMVEAPVQWLADRGVSRSVAGALCLAVGLLAGGLCTAWAVTAAWSELGRLRGHLPALLASAAAALDQVSRGASLAHSALPAGLRGVLSVEALRAKDAVGPLLQNLLAALQRAVAGLPEAVFAFFVAFATAYFLCRDRQRLAEGLTRHLSPAALARLRRLVQSLRESVWGLLRAQLLLSLATFSVSLLGLWIIGAPYAFLASLAAAVFDLLPVLGPALLYLPWAIGMALAHLPGAALALGAVLCAVATVRWCLMPLLFGRQIGLHPFVALASMYVGARLAGVTGLLLGPLCAVLLQAALGADPAAPGAPPGRGAGRRDTMALGSWAPALHRAGRAVPESPTCPPTAPHGGA